MLFLLALRDTEILLEQHPMLLTNFTCLIHSIDQLYLIPQSDDITSVSTHL
jgi:hypothetical protein